MIVIVRFFQYCTKATLYISNGMHEEGNSYSVAPCWFYVKSQS